MSIKVSVIIPVYNAEKYLSQCLNSILGQTLGDTEVICVDDCSSDKTPQILAEYARADGRVRVITNERNLRTGLSRNIGLASAEGEYVLFLDADDWFETDYLESAVKQADADCADICISGYDLIDDRTGEQSASNWHRKKKLLPEGTFSPEENADYLFQMTDGQVWDKLYRRSFLEKTGLSFPDSKAAEDTAFVYRTLLCAGRITSCPRAFVHYRVNRAESVSKSFAADPQAPFEAFETVYAFLLEHNLFEKYKKSFLNWAMEYQVWQVNNAPDESIRKMYLGLLRNRWIPELRLNEYPRSRFYDRGSYLKYLLAAYMPKKLYLAAVKAYKHLKNGK